MIPGEHFARKRYQILFLQCVRGERQADARGETLRNIFEIKKKKTPLGGSDLILEGPWCVPRA